MKSAKHRVVLCSLLLHALICAAQSTSSLDSAACTFTASPTYTIKSRASAAAVDSCYTVEGDVVVDGSITDSGNYNLSRVSNIDGSLLLENVPLGTITAENLVVDGNYTVIQTTGSLNTNISLFSAGNFSEQDVQPADSNAFTSPGWSVGFRVYNNVYVRNTTRTSLSLDMLDSGSVTILDNPLLMNLSITGFDGGSIIIKRNGLQSGSRSSSLQVSISYSSSNSTGVELSDVSVLDLANSNLVQINGDFLMLNNPISRFATTVLREVQGDLIISGNPFLEYFNLNGLVTVGGDLTITNNSIYLSSGSFGTDYRDLVLSLSSLQQVHGSVDIAGPFSRFDLIALKNVNGNMKLNTTENVSCIALASTFQTIVSNNFTCRSANESIDRSMNFPAPSSSSASSASSAPSADSGLTSGAEAGIGVGVALGAIACVAAAFFAWRRRKSRRQARGGFAWSTGQAQDESGYEKAELPPGDPRYEMGDDGEVQTTFVRGKQELPAAHGRSEAYQKDSDGSIKGFLVEAPGDEYWHGLERQSSNTSQKDKPRLATETLQPSTKNTPDLRTPATPSDGTAARSSTAISPVSSAGARGSHALANMSPVTSPASQHLQQFPTSHERPVSAMSVHEESPQAHSESLGVLQAGHQTLPAVAEKPPVPANEKTALLSEEGHDANDHAVGNARP